MNTPTKHPKEAGFQEIHRLLGRTSDQDVAATIAEVQKKALPTGTVERVEQIQIASVPEHGAHWALLVGPQTMGACYISGGRIAHPYEIHGAD